MFLSISNVFISIFKTILAGYLILILAGCSLAEMKKQTEEAENTAVISGIIENKSGQKGQRRVVVVSSPSENKFVIERRVDVDDHGRYLIYVEPGTYYMAAFIDADKNGIHSNGEHAQVYKEFLPITVVKDQIAKVNIEIVGEPKWQAPANAKVVDRKLLSFENIGRIVSLEDPMFSEEVGPLGLWKPIEYLDKYGAGLFMLQKYNKNKIPIIFVHGANGTAADWRTIVKNIDHKNFQPWILNYPSGVRLSLVSDYLKLATHEMQKKYRMKKIYVVAHSMGGLVTRSFIKKYRRSYISDGKKIKFVMTINSPMMGMDSAKSGVKYSPILVPSWRDVASDSKFIQRIHAWRWPDDLPYHLVFSYMSGNGDDGVVILESQIPLKLQSEATRIYGFNNTHAGLLRDQDFIVHFNKILKKSLN